MTSPAITEFDLTTSPLDGANLIEASAGTGKTFAIAGIVLRLLIEQGIPIGEILVVTYTIAATEELRDRIRTMIRRALRAFDRKGDDDAFLNALVSAHTDPGKAQERLKATLRDFDEAAIHTIHSFCQRTLRDHAFESLYAFDMDFIADEGPLREEIVQDFWRRHFYEAPVEIVAYAMENKADLASLIMLVSGQAQLHRLHISPDVSLSDVSSLSFVRETFALAAVSWETGRDEVLSLLRCPQLDKRSFKSPERLIAAMDRYLQSGIPYPAIPELVKFTPSGLKTTGKGTKPPEHPFFVICRDLLSTLERFAAEMDAWLMGMKAELFRHLREELPRRKSRRRTQSFDDLLLNLDRALAQPEAEALISAIRVSYKAALIDEFQDTDPVSYAIFHRLFRCRGHRLFFIGDPKQAIYSFRGADLFAYLGACNDVDRHYTLSRNWRSAPGLICAVNTLFGRPERPFIYEQIAFSPVVAGDAAKRTELIFDPPEKAPLQLWHVTAKRLDVAGALGNKERTKRIIASAIAGEIKRLLSMGQRRKACMGDQGLKAGDIAILVRTRYEARNMQEALRTVTVPSVLHSAGNVFDADEARDLRLIIAAIAEPAREGAIRAALATDIMGLTGETLAALQENERDWEAWLFRFREYHQLWERNGFIAMFRHLLSAEGVRDRLLSLPDGERRLTNVLHLAEILHKEALEQKLGMAGLVKWLTREIHPDTARNEAHELRLESDDMAVKIVTIHKSKGLEYPIVFCPFNWDGSHLKDGAFTYHRQDGKDDWSVHLALDGRSNPNREDAEREILAENVRLLYVAMTRAKFRCYIVWGPLKDSGTSSLAYILHHQGNETPLSLSDLETSLCNLTDEDYRRELDVLACRAGGTIQISELSEEHASPLTMPEGTGERLSCRSFTAAIEQNERIASFSYLTAHRVPAALEFNPDDKADLPDRDTLEVSTLTDPGDPLTGIFAFPKGAGAGTLLHDILEHIDFQNQDRNIVDAIVAEKLREYGFDPLWQETVTNTIDKVLTVPLNHTIAGLRLAEISWAERVSELEFHFPLKPLSAAHLSSLFDEISGISIPGFPEQMGRLTFQPANGFMKGFIDLVFRYRNRFYLVDWKSNYLGRRIADYGQEPLREVMTENFYVLQYHLYVLALHRYLRMRVPDYDYGLHFGGVFYIFLRGIDPAWGPEFGIFYDRPEQEAIAILERRLIADSHISRHHEDGGDDEPA
ncbi:MAG: RecBCD enzyme subunit RecB [Syntrophus sp. SKADARSKE-3]|nr:RecBCD enzyme subunit RecB [Syntrophus sp. SKADARSKE-3]